MTKRERADDDRDLHQADAPRSSTADDGLYELADTNESPPGRTPGPTPGATNTHPSGRAVDAIAPATIDRTRVCTNCLHQRPVDETACVNCRFDPTRGLQADTIVHGTPLGEAGLTCRGCGHLLRGAIAPRCPECGRVAGRLRSKTARDADGALVMHEHVKVPLITAGAGALVLVAFTGLFDSWVGAVALLVSLVVFVPVAATILKICAAFGLDIDAPWYLTAIQVAVTTVAFLLVFTLSSLLLPGVLASILAILVTIVVVEQSFEVDYKDAILLAIIIGLLFFTTQNTLAWAFPALFRGMM